MRRALLATAVVTIAMPALTTGVWAAGKKAAESAVNVGLDEVHTLTFRGPVSSVYVGNPTIADITMIDARHAFVQGKGYGRTNIVAMNQDGVQVFGAKVNVTGAEGGATVILNRGTQRITLSCAGQHCEPTPMPGDGKDSYDPSNAIAAAHQAAARAASLADAGGH